MIYGVYLWGIYEVTISCYIYAHMYVHILYGIYMSHHEYTYYKNTCVFLVHWCQGPIFQNMWKWSDTRNSRYRKSAQTIQTMILLGQLVHQFWPIEKTYWVSWCIFGVCWKYWALWYPKISYAYINIYILYVHKTKHANTWSWTPCFETTL